MGQKWGVGVPRVSKSTFKPDIRNPQVKIPPYAKFQPNRWRVKKGQKMVEEGQNVTLARFWPDF